MHIIVALCATANSMRDVIRWSLAYILHRHLLVNAALALFFFYGLRSDLGSNG